MKIAKHCLSALAVGPLVIGFLLSAATAGMEPPPPETVAPSEMVPAPAMRSILPPPPMPKA